MKNTIFYVKDKFLKLFEDQFARNLLTMVTGNAIAQAIPIIANVFIARLYEPIHIGEFVFFTTIVNNISIVAGLKYNEAIVLSKNEKESNALFFLSILLVLLTSFIVFLAVFFLNNWLIENIEFPLLIDYLYLLPISILLMGLFTTYNFFNNYNKEYKVLASTRITQNFSMSFFQIVCNSLKLGGLIYGYIIGLILSIIHSFKRTKKVYKSSFNKKMIKFVFIKYIDFPRYNMTTSFINKLSYGLPVILLPLFYDISIAGYYSYSSLIVLGPMGIISSSMQQVFYKKIAEMNAESKKIYVYVKQTYQKLFLVGFIPHLFLLIFSPFLFGYIFGEKWEVSGEYTRYLLPWFFLIFLNSSISSIYVIKNKQKHFLLFETIILFLRSCALILGYYFFNNALFSVVLYGIVGFLYEIFVLIYFLKISKD